MPRKEDEKKDKKKKSKAVNEDAEAVKDKVKKGSKKDKSAPTPASKSAANGANGANGKKGDVLRDGFYVVSFAANALGVVLLMLLGRIVTRLERFPSSAWRTGGGPPGTSPPTTR
mmetsp:Transcript_1462/g.4769  ORF Transcript_1462/g.4769 Transcript_1462/m.4769 type:complete len:115 (+) Transcript_1462:147-491(+)